MSEPLRLIDPHVHMSARTTDDYEAMAAAGVVKLMASSIAVQFCECCDQCFGVSGYAAGPG